MSNKRYLKSEQQVANRMLKNARSILSNAEYLEGENPSGDGAWKDFADDWEETLKKLVSHLRIMANDNLCPECQQPDCICIKEEANR